MPEPSFSREMGEDHEALISGIHSLGYRTDLMLLSLGGAEFTTRDRYLVVRTPDRPTFYSGNFLLYPNPPEPGDDERWEDDFVGEFADPPLHHRTFGWDRVSDDRGHSQAFVTGGYELAAQRVLSTASAIVADDPGHGAAIRRLEGDEDWEAVLELQLACDDTRRERDPNFLDFKQRQVQAYRDMASRGAGAWFAAFIDGRMVADLGIYAVASVGRYHSVETHPEFRRRGLCRSLVSAAASYAREQLGARTLVIVADPRSHAIEIYRRLGFGESEWQFEMSKMP